MSPLVLACDGCGAVLEQSAAKERGRLAKCFYCPDCAKIVDLAARDIEAERVRVIREFAAYRKQRLTSARDVVKRLPDD